MCRGSDDASWRKVPVWTNSRSGKRLMMGSTRHWVFPREQPRAAEGLEAGRDGLLTGDPLIDDPAGCWPIGHHGAVEAGERDELVGLVRLIQAGDGSEAEIDAGPRLAGTQGPAPAGERSDLLATTRRFRPGPDGGGDRRGRVGVPTLRLVNAGGDGGFRAVG